MNWKTTYTRESPALHSHLLARGAPPDLAEDIIQEVFMAAIAAGSRIERPRAYLFQAARNALNRERGRLRPILESVPVVECRDGGGDGEAINRALARLPLEQREVVVLRVWHGLSFREISEALEIPPDTAASRWRYGLAKLRSLVEKGAA
jgi:RNA polymerase sigma-70 factor, ECF subfamily